MERMDTVMRTGTTETAKLADTAGRIGLSVTAEVNGTVGMVAQTKGAPVRADRPDCSDCFLSVTVSS
jgi:hypothetical protein